MRPPPPPPPQVIYVERKRGTSCLTWLVALIAIPIMIGAFLTELGGGGGASTASTSGSPEAQAPKQEGDVLLSKQSGRRVFGRCIVDATVTNTHKGEVRDIVFAARISGESGKRLANLSYTATIRLKPGESRTLKGMDFGPIPEQSARIEIGVINYVRP